MQSRALHLFVLLSCLASWSAVMASRVAPEDQLSTRPAQQLQDNPSTAHRSTDKKKKGSTDFEDQDPDVRSHWALLVAGSSGWFNYRHQADVFHAYQVLLAGGYHRDHIVVMAADDIAQDSENPMPGKVFNMPGGPNVYEGVRIDYRGADVTAENFLSVLLGDAAAMAGKGTGRVVDSSPHDKLFVFYSDHGAAGVLGMPTGPFLYADEFIKTLKKKHSKKGFKEAVLYIEACESGSMFEGLLGNDMDIYVTTAANAIESSWATYCPTFYSPAGGDDVIADALMMTNGDSPAVAAVPGGWQQWVVRGLGWMQQQLGRITGAPQQGPAAAAAAVSGVKPSPQFTTCLGDLYSVAWMEDAESSDLTNETLLQQYKNVKVRTSQNFTYEQGSHVMQYGDLDIDKELAGDYEGMMHNGSTPTPTTPSQDWIDAAEAGQQQRTPIPVTLSSSSRSGDAGVNGLNAALQRYSSPAAFLQKVKARSSKGPHSHSHNSHKSHRSHSHSVEQRDADLVPLAAAAHSSSCPRKRAAAAAALKKATADRLALEGKARTAVSQLLRQPGVGYNAYVMMSSMGWSPSRVLQGVGVSQQQQQQVLGEPSLLLSGGAAAAVGEYVEALMGPLPGSVAGGALVEDWQCLRNMVQAWEGACGVLDQYGMKLTRMFANLCNVGVQPQQLHTTLTAGPCTAAGRR